MTYGMAPALATCGTNNRNYKHINKWLAELKNIDSSLKTLDKEISTNAKLISAWGCNEGDDLTDVCQRMTQLMEVRDNHSISYFCFSIFLLWCWLCMSRKKGQVRRRDEGKAALLLQLSIITPLTCLTLFSRSSFLLSFLASTRFFALAL